jgi:hypothetical protein
MLTEYCGKGISRNGASNQGLLIEQHKIEMNIEKWNRKGTFLLIK